MPSLLGENSLWLVVFSNAQKTRVRIISKARKLRGLQYIGSVYIATNGRLVYSCPFTVAVNVQVLITKALLHTGQRYR